MIQGASLSCYYAWIDYESVICAACGLKSAAFALRLLLLLRRFPLPARFGLFPATPGPFTILILLLLLILNLFLALIFFFRFLFFRFLRDRLNPAPVHIL